MLFAMTSNLGKFITLEGIEGAGKGSSLEHICRIIESSGKKLLCTREPGGTPLGESIRELLLSHRHSGMAEETELLMMFAARAEHLARRIRPALEDGAWVICDRFTDASYAYQGGGRRIDARRIQVLENWVQGPLRPDLTLLLDLPVELGLERAGKRSRPDRFESEDVRFFQAVRETYLAIAAAEPERMRIIDAAPPLADVQAQIEAVLTEFLNHGRS